MLLKCIKEYLLENYNIRNISYIEITQVKINSLLLFKFAVAVNKSVY